MLGHFVFKNVCFWRQNEYELVLFYAKTEAEIMFAGYQTHIDVFSLDAS